MHKPVIVVAFSIAWLSASCSDVAPPDSDVARGQKEISHVVDIASSCFVQ